MKIVNPSYEILTDEEGGDILRLLEYAGRTCYKSEDKITDESAEKFVKMLISRGHEAMIEHFNMTVKFIVNRGFTHELVRHRLVSYAQESTRYCNYGKQDEITVIEPYWFKEAEITVRENWKIAMAHSEETYMELLNAGLPPQAARGVLPIDLKTEIVTTTNLREWRHIFKLRTAKAAHPDMQRIMRPLLKEMQQNIPVIFDDIEVVW